MVSATSPELAVPYGWRACPLYSAASLECFRYGSGARWVSNLDVVCRDAALVDVVVVAMVVGSGYGQGGGACMRAVDRGILWPAWGRTRQVRWLVGGGRWSAGAGGRWSAHPWKKSSFGHHWNWVRRCPRVPRPFLEASSLRRVTPPRGSGFRGKPQLRQNGAMEASTHSSPPWVHRLLASYDWETGGWWWLFF